MGPSPGVGRIFAVTNAMKNCFRSLAAAPRYSTFCALLTFGLLPGCSGQSQAGAKSAEAAEQGAAPGPGPAAFDLEKTMKREATGLTDHSVEAPGAAWSAKAPAAAELKLTRDENVMLVDIPIGSQSPVRCQVFPESLDAGGTLSGVLKDSAARVEYRSITPSGVRLIGGTPVAFIETVYVSDVAGGKAAGGLKLAMQSREQESILCVHDELGYRQTFQTVSSAFFASFKVKSAPPNESTYSEVAKARIGETDVGFSSTHVKPGSKPGEREFSYSNTTLVPTSPKDVIFGDTYELYSYDAKNQLRTGTWVEGSGGEVTLKVVLTRSSDGKYAYEGEVSGKPLKGVLQAPRGLATTLDIATRLKKKLKTDAPFELVVAEYHPSIDPTALLDVTYRHQKGDPARQVVVTMSNRTITAEVDDDGLPKTAWFEIGKNRLTIERLARDGHL
jgi:hypothetical protein